jgi:coenzyme F420-reducing hydrogenase gamma subunit
MSMPNYTLEQKAAAFDLLWESCGAGRGMLNGYVSRDISRPGCPPNEATILRVPVYEFQIFVEGDMPLFRDALHYLATRV